MKIFDFSCNTAYIVTHHFIGYKMGIDQYEPQKLFSNRLDNQHQLDYDMKI